MTDTLDLAGRSFGEFVLRERIGEGSFGTVYCCEQPLLAREAVVKVLHPRLSHDAVSVQRFLREAQLASRLDHPYAAHVYAFGLEQHDCLLWIAMERVHGVTLKAWLRAHGPMPLADLVPFFECVAEVVQTAHDHGIVHRDLKPSNMMVIERAGRLLPKLLDFGVAKLLDGVVAPDTTQDLLRRALSTEALTPSGLPGPERRFPPGPETLTGPWAPPRRDPPASPADTLSTASARSDATRRLATSRLTSHDATVGSPPYMAPEQWSNAPTVGPTSDLYSLGVVAFEAVTGRRPFNGDSLADYADLHCHAKVPELGPGFPKPLDELFQRALAKRPDDRWPTSLELAAALRSASGLGPHRAVLPRLDPKVRDPWLACAPLPLAQSVAALDAATSPHQARDAAQDLGRSVLRYLIVIALATRATLREDYDDPALLDMVRALEQRDLGTEERVRLLRLLVRPLVSFRSLHPIPELIDLVTTRSDGLDGLEPLLALHASVDHASSEDAVRVQLGLALPTLSQFLEHASFVLNYSLVVPRGEGAESWIGTHCEPPPMCRPAGGEPRDGHPMLLDREGRVIIDLWPLAQAKVPSDCSDRELYLFDGRSRYQGARMIAAPSGFVQHDPNVWQWVATQLIAEVETKGRMRDQLRVAAIQWDVRGRSPGLLWRGRELSELERWLEQNTSAMLDPRETAFAAACRRRARRSGRRLRAVAAVTAAIAAIATTGIMEYRRELQSKMLERIAEQSEVEQGRQALLHDEPAEARRHLARAYDLGDHDPDVGFMLARALEPYRAERARFSSAKGRMWSAAFSPEGEHVVTTDDDEAQVWDIRTNQLLYHLPHGDTVYSAVYTPDGTRIATACGDGAVRIWNARSGVLLHELRENRRDNKRSRYFIVAVSPDGSLVASIDMLGQAAHVWNAAGGAALAELDNDGSEYPSLSFSADGHWLATSGGNDVRVFDTTTWRRSTTLQGPRIHRIAFDPLGPRLVTGTTAGDVSIWDVTSGVRVRHLKEVGATISALAFSPDGRLVATADRRGSEEIWDASSGALVSQLEPVRAALLSIEFDPTSRFVAAAASTGQVTIADVSLGMPTATFEGPGNLVRMVHFDPASRSVIGASWDGTARVWDARSPYRRWSSPTVDDDCGPAGGAQPDQRLVIVGCTRRNTRVWDTMRDQLVAELPPVAPAPAGFAAASAAVSAAGDRAAVARANTVEIYELPGGKLVRTLEHPASVTSIAFTSSGHDLVIGAADGSLSVARDGGESIALPRALDGIDSVMALGDGRIVVTDARRQLRVIDPSRSTVIAALDLTTRVRLLRASADGHRLVTIPSFTERTAPPALWDLERYRLIAPLKGHSARVMAARFVKDDAAVLTTGGDGTVRLWSASSGRPGQTFRASSPIFGDAVLRASMVIAGGSDGVLWFWDLASGRPLWKLPAHHSDVVGMHLEGEDLITRGLAGDISRWTLLPPDRVINVCADARELASANSEPCDIVAR